MGEVHLLELAEAELAGKCVWNYGHQPKFAEKADGSTRDVPIGGTKILVYFDAELEQYLAADTSRSRRGKDIILEKDLLDFVGGLQEEVADYISSVPIRTEHVRKGQIFRAHSQYRHHVWRDWAIVDWEEEGLLPNKISGFVDLRELPKDSLLNYGGIDLKPGIFAVVKNAVYSTDEAEIKKSELFVPIAKEVGGLTLNNVSHLSFFLADVDAFVDPVAVIPDLGGQPNGYFLLRERAGWSEMFTKYLEAPRVQGEMVDSDVESARVQGEMVDSDSEMSL